MWSVVVVEACPAHRLASQSEAPERSQAATAVWRIAWWCEPYASPNSRSATRRVASAERAGGTCW